MIKKLIIDLIFILHLIDNQLPLINNELDAR